MSIERLGTGWRGELLADGFIVGCELEAEELRRLRLCDPCAEPRSSREWWDEPFIDIDGLIIRRGLWAGELRRLWLRDSCVTEWSSGSWRGEPFTDGIGIRCELEAEELRRL